MSLLTPLLRRSVRQRTSPLDFAPDILRIQASPPHPLPRAVLGAALFLLAVSLVWAAVAQLDIVAVAQGKLVPQSYVKIVQPAEAGIIQEILVREGEQVKAGQVLMRLDSTLSLADLETIRNEYRQKSLALRRIDAELAGRPLAAQADDPAGLFQEALAQYAANRRALDAAIAQEQAGLERARQEIAVAAETRDKLEKTLPHYREQDAAYQKLLKDGFAGKVMANDKARELIEKEQDLKAQQFVIAREKANMAQSERRMTQIRSEYERQLRAERADIGERVARLHQDLAKQDHRNALLELKAPQDGLVKDLATHTVGTVVQPATILMTLVPDSEQLRAEVWLSNEDAGWVRAGQESKVKFAAFQFQKYGMLDGKVEHVAADAAEKPEGGEATKGSPSLAYRTYIALGSQKMLVDGNAYRLSPGMQVTAEIRLGQRSVLEYLLSPVRRAFQEAGRER